MRRRNFLSKLFGRKVEESMLAVQLVIPVFALPDLRAKLHRVIEGTSGAEQTPAERSLYYRKVTAILRQALPMSTYGFWEYLEHEEAEIGFREWVTEIEAAMAFVDEETVDGVDEVAEGARFDVDQELVAVSMIFHLRGALETLRDWSPEDDDSWTREAFATLLGEIERFDATGVLADAFYVVPGNDDDGLTEWDLAEEGWEHLEMLR